MRTLERPTSPDPLAPPATDRTAPAGPTHDRVDGPAWSTTTGGAPPPPAPRLSDPAPAPAPGRRGLMAVALVAALSGAAVATPIALFVDDEGSSTAGSADPEVEQAVAAAPDTGDESAAGGTAATAAPIDVVAVAEEVSPSVVRINVSTAGGAGTGSGVVFDDDGHIVTNNHVVGDADTVGVSLADGRELEARVVGTDPATDLAVVRVDDADLAPIAVASDPPSIGQPVVAIGSPFGLDGSVTSGIVSALNREVAGGDIPLTGLVQTDAAINPGNSGGALVDADGALVGINTAIASSGGGSDGIGFAIDTATVESVAVDLVTDGAVERSWLGVAGTTTVGADGRPTGAQVEEVVADSPAEAAGLQAGDRIVRLDGEDVETFPDLAARLVRLEPGDQVTLAVERDGTTLDLDVTLGEAS